MITRPIWKGCAMCRFCVEHGEGKRWYLQASNYAYDLESDLRRRDYIVDFINGFERSRSNAIAAMELLDSFPAPLSRTAKSAFSRHMQSNHFGQPVPLEECDQILDLATSITVIPCICRMHAPNKKAEEVCVLVTAQPVEAVVADGFAGYQDGPDLADFNRVSKEEAMALLRGCEERGLMHSIWTFQTPFAAAICNCNNESGCFAMRLTSGYGMKMMWRGEWVAHADRELCTDCGACAKLCPFGAIEAKPRSVTFHDESCWGCGVCRAACRRDAIALVDRRDVPAVANLW